MNKEQLDWQSEIKETLDVIEKGVNTVGTDKQDEFGLENVDDATVEVKAAEIKTAAAKIKNIVQASESDTLQKTDADIVEQVVNDPVIKKIVEDKNSDQNLVSVDAKKVTEKGVDIQDFSEEGKKEVIYGSLINNRIIQLFDPKKDIINDSVVPINTTAVKFQTKVSGMVIDGGVPINGHLNLVENLQKENDNRKLQVLTSVQGDAKLVNQVGNEYHLLSGVTYNNLADVMTIESVDTLTNEMTLDSQNKIAKYSLSNGFVVNNVNAPFYESVDGVGQYDLASTAEKTVSVKIGTAAGELNLAKGVGETVTFTVKGSGTLNVVHKSLTVSGANLVMTGLTDSNGVKVDSTSTGYTDVETELKKLSINGYVLDSYVSHMSIPKSKNYQTDIDVSRTVNLRTGPSMNTKQSLFASTKFEIGSVETMQKEKDLLIFLQNVMNETSSLEYNKDKHLVTPTVLTGQTLDIAATLLASENKTVIDNLTTLVGDRIISLAKSLIINSGFDNAHIGEMGGKTPSGYVVSAFIGTNVSKILGGSYKKGDTEVLYKQNALPADKDNVYIFVTSKDVVAKRTPVDTSAPKSGTSSVTFLDSIVRKHTGVIEGTYIQTGEQVTHNHVSFIRSATFLGNNLVAKLTIEKIEDHFSSKVYIASKAVL